MFIQAQIYAATFVKFNIDSSLVRPYEVPFENSY